MNLDFRKYFAPIIAILFLGLMFIYNQLTKEQNPVTYNSNNTELNEIDTKKRPETGEIRFDNTNDSKP
jgi:putative Mn2+ efflux pump MntP